MFGNLNAEQARRNLTEIYIRNDNMDVKRLKEIMQICGVSQKNLAELTGLSKAGISQYIHGINKSGKKAMQRIADALDVSVEWLQGMDAAGAETERLGLRKISVSYAAKLLGVGAQCVREGLKQGSMTFGSVVFAYELDNSGQYVTFK